MSIDPKKAVTKNMKATSKISTPRKHPSDYSADALEMEPVREKVKRQKVEKKHNLPTESTTTGEKAKLARSERQHEHAKIVETGFLENDLDLRQAKQKRRKSDKVDGVGEIPDISTIHNGDATMVEEVISTGTDRKSKRKRRAEGRAEGGLPLEGGKRKRVKKDEDERNASDGLPDPTKDASLTDQARKALSYAYDQFNAPSSWKFNKARQNWLIRNIWSDQAIPDTYVPLLTRYLANVQGGVREKLIGACQSCLLPEPTKDVTSAVPPGQTTVDGQTQTTVAKQIRARAVLDVIPHPTEGIKPAF